MTTRGDLRRQHREARRRCEASIDELELPVVFDVDDVRAALERRRGRRIVIAAKPDAAWGGPCGVWLGTDTEDFIFVDDATSPLHRSHIVLHELGHLLGGHSSLEEPESDFLTRLVPDLNPSRVRTMLARGACTTPQEHEAELFATLLSSRIVTGRRARPAPESADDILDHVLRAR